MSFSCTCSVPSDDHYADTTTTKVPPFKRSSKNKVVSILSASKCFLLTNHNSPITIISSQQKKTKKSPCKNNSVPEGYTPHGHTTNIIVSRYTLTRNWLVLLFTIFIYCTIHMSYYQITSFQISSSAHVNITQVWLLIRSIDYLCINNCSGIG